MFEFETKQNERFLSWALRIYPNSEMHLREVPKLKNVGLFEDASPKHPWSYQKSCFGDASQKAPLQNLKYGAIRYASLNLGGKSGISL